MVNAHGGTLEETRHALRSLMGVIFEEERRVAEERLAGKEAVRENFYVPLNF